MKNTAIAPPERLTAVMAVRLTFPEYAMIELFARRENRSVSAMCRLLTTEAIAAREVIAGAKPARRRPRRQAP